MSNHIPAEQPAALGGVSHIPAEQPAALGGVSHIPAEQPAALGGVHARMVGLSLAGAAACVMISACAAQGGRDITQSEYELGGSAGSAAPKCVPVDVIDSVPDGIDEDCDGKIDEDVDHKPCDCPPFSHIIQGTRGDDVLRGTKGRDCILGYGGNDTIYADLGDDVVFGGPGNDHIYGGGGIDMIYGGTGNDTIDVSASMGSIAYGEAGQDTLLGSAGIDTLYGGDDNDSLNGAGGADLMDGGGCHDLLLGGSGIDLALGGAGIDACEAEAMLTCEKAASARVSCQSDANCAASDRCAAMVHFCVPRTAALCGACVATASVDTTCDGIDDDCDGQIDEDFPTHATSCGMGACASTGKLACVSAAVVDSCHARPAASATDATCNGVDDDCNGKVDDGFVSQATSCGAGVCASTGTTACISGAVSDSCHPRSATSSGDDTCNGLDDNCNGKVDEGYSALVTTCGVGACSNAGATSCVSGVVLNSCQALPAPSTTDTTCNGVDDDCNGKVDDGFVSVSTSCGVGACAAAGSTSCVNGAVADSCQALPAPSTTDTSCNGIDDDCNGKVDDAFASTQTTCGPAACSSTGSTSCVNGAVVDSCVGEPACASTGPAIGSQCQADSDCAGIGPSAVCETAFPGGYCYIPCDANGACPSGTMCWLGSACVVACNAANGCNSPNLVCAGNPGIGVPEPAFCHPTCATATGCPSGTACNPSTDFCQ